MSSDGFEDIVVADEKVRLLKLEQAGLVVESIHAEEYGLRDVLRSAKLRHQMFEIPPVGFTGMGF